MKKEKCLVTDGAGNQFIAKQTQRKKKLPLFVKAYQSENLCS
jgi:hypothetical protein